MIPGSAIQTVLWAVFLACSWTWCIGMFLPVLFVRDYGIVGWLVFAVPNIAGAAAMGWVLRRRDSVRLVVHHESAVVAFSLITFVFHVFFVAWAVTWVAGVTLGPALSLAGIVAFLVLPRLLKKRADLLAAGGVFMVSLVVFAASLQSRYVPFLTPGGTHGTRPATDLLFLAPVTVFGFALCPYLDATFNRARQQTAAAVARRAFALGFGAFFLLMIVFTLCYAGWLAPLADARSSEWPAALRVLLGTHLIVQAAYTMALHLRVLYEGPEVPLHGGTGGPPVIFGKTTGGPPVPRLNRLLITAICAAIALVLAAWSHFPGRYHDLSHGEIVYRCFMAFYGLVFPAYVWLCIIPMRKGTPAPSVAALTVFAGAVGLAAPLFWLGFIERQTPWLIPGLLIVLAARVALPRRGPNAAGSLPALPYRAAQR